MPPLRLEVFEAGTAQDRATVVTDINALDEARLASYEQGYAAGWEDCAAAQSQEKSQMAADLAHNLQSLNFTYHEARAHVLKALEPLLVDLITHILPDVAKAALAPTVLSAIMPLAEKMADAPIKLLHNPGAHDAIEPMLQKITGPPLTLVEEPTLGEGQVFLQLGDSEVRVDLDGAIAEIKAAVDDFFNLIAKDPKNG